MVLVGYVCVSTAAQEGALQRDALVNAGSSNLFDDKASDGKSDRPGLIVALAYIRAWNTLRKQGLRDQNPDGFPDDIAARLAPIA